MANIIPDGFFAGIDLDALDDPAPQDKPFSSEVADRIQRDHQINVNDPTVQSLERARAYLKSANAEDDVGNLLRFTNPTDVAAALDALGRVLHQVDVNRRVAAKLVQMSTRIARLEGLIEFINNSLTSSYPCENAVAEIADASAKLAELKLEHSAFLNSVTGRRLGPEQLAA